MADKYFCFFENIRVAIKKLPRERQLEFREAIEDYVFDGIEPSDPVFAALLQILKPSLDKKGRGGQVGNKNAQKSATNTNQNKKNESKRIKTNKNESNESGYETPNTKHQTLNTKPQGGVGDKSAKQVLPVHQAIADYLADNLSVRLNRKISNRGWADEIRKLCEAGNIDPPRIRDALEWHFRKYDRPYRLEIQSARTLREKFSRLETAYLADEPDLPV